MSLSKTSRVGAAAWRQGIPWSLIPGLGVPFGVLLAMGPSVVLILMLAILCLSAVAIYLSRRPVKRFDSEKSYSLAEIWTLWTIRSSLLLFAASIQMKITLFLLVLLCIVSALLSIPYGRRGKGIPLDIALFLTAALLVWVVEPQTRILALAAVSGLALAISMRRLSIPRSKVLNAVIDSVGVYLVASVATYYVLNVSSPSDLSRLGTPESSLGYFRQRVTFPFDLGITTAPAMAACFIVGYLPNARPRLSGPEIFRMLAGISALVVLLAGNGRAAIAIALALGAAAFYLPHLLVRFVFPLIVGVMLLPFWWPLLNPLLGNTVESLSRQVPILERTTSISTMGDRTIIWDAIRRQSRIIPLQHQLVGYGANGQFKSGASGLYAYHFRRGTNFAPYVGAHNSVLQQYLESGIVGVLILFALIWATLRRLKPLLLDTNRDSLMLGRGAVAMIAALAAAASTEAILAPGARANSVWLLILLAISTSAHMSGRIGTSSEGASAGVAKTGLRNGFQKIVSAAQ